jgi:hypothetical protein
MKRQLTAAIFTLFTFSGIAQNSDPIEDIYRRYEGEKFSVALNLDASIFEDFDIDIDTDDLQQRIRGTVKRVRFIGFEDYRPGLRNEKQIIEELLRLGYELADTPSEWNEDDDHQLLILKKKGKTYSPHLILIINDRNERDAVVLILSGSINFNTEAS